jgi:hypothetical protein
MDLRDAVIAVRDFREAKSWWLRSGIIIFLVTFILKLMGVFRRIGKRWIYIWVPLAGIASALCSAFVGGLSWDAAWIVLTSAPTAALLNDLVKRGILAEEPETPLKPI